MLIRDGKKGGRGYGGGGRGINRGGTVFYAAQASQALAGRAGPALPPSLHGGKCWFTPTPS